MARPELQSTMIATTRCLVALCVFGLSLVSGTQLMRRSRSLVIVFVVAALTCVGPAALAAWNKSGNGNGRSAATTMPAGNTPTAVVSNRNVQVTWAAVTMPGGSPVEDYRVKRYNTSGVEQTIKGACDVAISTTTCTENGVPSGTWRYAVAPRLGTWQGAFGTMSANVTVAAPSLTLNSPTTITQFPSQLTGAIASFIPGQSVTVRLDNATTGTVLPSSLAPATVPANGNANLTVTGIPNTISNGTHTLYAIGNNGDIASATFTVNASFPTPTSLAAQNGGTAGVLDRGDQILVTYSEAMDASSFCSTWSGTGNQTITADNVVTVSVVNNGAPGGNDLLTVSTSAAACGGAFHFGSVNLGSPNYVSSNSTFRGTGGSASTISYTAGTTRRMTIVLGARASGTSSGTVSGTITYGHTPDPAILGANGRPITGSI
jgi:hypothetical protein